MRPLAAFIVGTGTYLALVALAHAQGSGTFVPLSDANFQAIFNTGGASGGGDLASFINSGFKAALSIGAILAVLRIAYAGYLYMGTDMWHTKSHAKEILGDVVLGLLLLLGIYLILWQINPCLLDLNVLRSIDSPNATCTGV